MLAYKMAIKRLRTDVNMYDWISADEERLKATFRVYWYAGHIMFAVPRKQYAKSPWIQKEHEWLIICATAMASYSMTKTKN